MCGISVAIGKDEQNIKQNIQEMVEKQQHRGADHHHHLLLQQGNHTIALGHNLLQISAEKEQLIQQPISSICQRFQMVFNGQIYGHLAIREKESLRNYPFRNNSDTETLLALLATEGIPALKQIEGMFAIALLDKNTGILHIVRDRFGIKPLFYIQQENEFYAASHLFALPIKPTPNQIESQAAAHYFTYKYCPVGSTLINQVKELKPAGYLQIFEGKIQLEGYYQDISFKKPEERGHLVQQKVLNIIQENLEKQTDKPQQTALMLSGGIDSTLLAVSLKDLGKEKQIPAITAVYSNGKQTDTDAAFAKEVALKAGLQWIPAYYDNSLIEEIPQWVKTLSQPVADMAGLLTWHLSKNEFFKGRVLLSGAGADELFLGYRRHKALWLLLELHNTISNKVLRNLLSLGAQILLPSKWSEIKHFLSNVKPNDVHSSFLNMQKQIGFKESFLNIHSPRYIAAPKEKLPDNDYLQYAAFIEVGNYLVGDILAVSDNAAMSFGKEIRLPYLSNELQENLSKVKGMQLMDLGQKYMLREILKERYQLKEVANRPKKGFGIDWSEAIIENPWAKNEIKQLHNSPFLKQIWNETALQNILNATLQGKKQTTQIALSMLIYHHWCLAHIK